MDKAHGARYIPSFLSTLDPALITVSVTQCVRSEITGWNVFNQDALFKGYKKRLDKLPKAKSDASSAKTVRHTFPYDCSLLLAGEGGGTIPGPQGGQALSARPNAVGRLWEACVFYSVIEEVKYLFIRGIELATSLTLGFIFIIRTRQSTAEGMMRTRGACSALWTSSWTR